MKVKTFKNILIIICIVNFFFWLDGEEKLLPIIFNMKEPTLYAVNSGFISWFKLLAFPLTLICFFPLFKSYSYNKMNKKTYSLFIPVFAFILIFPFAFYPSRTEITPDRITTHNFWGETSEVYLFEDVKKVNVEIFERSSYTKTGVSNNYIDFSCGVEFEDGFEYYFYQNDGDIGWKIIESIDRVVKEYDIEKEVTGKVLYKRISESDSVDLIFEYDNFYEYIYHEELLYSLIME